MVLKFKHCYIVLHVYIFSIFLPICIHDSIQSTKEYQTALQKKNDTSIFSPKTADRKNEKKVKKFLRLF